MASHPENGGEERRMSPANRPLQCVVVTPEKTLLDETVDFVALPLFDGELGVLPGRSPLLGRLGYGGVRTPAPCPAAPRASAASDTASSAPGTATWSIGTTWTAASRRSGTTWSPSS